METVGITLGIYWDNGKENENYRDYRDDVFRGPGALQRIMDLGILIVVARIDDLEYDPSLVPNQDMLGLVDCMKSSIGKRQLKSGSMT